MTTEYNNCDRPKLFNMWTFLEYDRFLFLQGAILELIIFNQSLPMFISIYPKANWNT